SANDNSLTCTMTKRTTSNETASTPLRPARHLALLLGLVLLIAIWAAREDRRLLLWAAAWAISIWGGSSLVRPSWFQEAFDSVALNAVAVSPQSILPVGLVLVSWRLPWYA